MAAATQAPSGNLRDGAKPSARRAMTARRLSLTSTRPHRMRTFAHPVGAMVSPLGTSNRYQTSCRNRPDVGINLDEPLVGSFRGSSMPLLPHNSWRLLSWQGLAGLRRSARDHGPADPPSGERCSIQRKNMDTVCLTHYGASIFMHFKALHGLLGRLICHEGYIGTVLQADSVAATSALKCIR